MYKLKDLQTEKLSIKLNEILKGEILYRTTDGRILDFEECTEKQTFFERL